MAQEDGLNALFFGAVGVILLAKQDVHDKVMGRRLVLKIST